MIVALAALAALAALWLGAFAVIALSGDTSMAVNAALASDEQIMETDGFDAVRTGWAAEDVNASKVA